MNQQDKAFMTVFSAVLGGLVVLAVVIFIIAQLVSGASLPEEDRTERQLAEAEQRIQPVGRVVVAGSEEAEADDGAQAEADEAMTGEQVYASACSACHDAGVLEAPVAGDNDAWTARYEEKGMDMLLDHAINGFNQMPARGGNANLSDRNVHDAIVYMLEQSSVEVAAADRPDDGEAMAEESEEPAAEEPAAEEPAAEEPAAEEPAAEEPAAEAQTAEQETAEEPAAEEPAAEEPAETQTADAGADDAASGVEQAASDADVEIPDGRDLARGEQTYGQVCAVCHDQGVAGAPKLGDQEAWTPRLAQGWETLTQHTLQGYNAMPAKGGRPDLPDEQILDSLAYMIEQSR